MALSRFLFHSEFLDAAEGPANLGDFTIQASAPWRDAQKETFVVSLSNHAGSAPSVDKLRTNGLEDRRQTTARSSSETGSRSSSGPKIMS
jgi:hypothetical protein